MKNNIDWLYDVTLFLQLGGWQEERKCVCACVRVRACVCVRACACVCLHACKREREEGGGGDGSTVCYEVQEHEQPDYSHGHISLQLSKIQLNNTVAGVNAQFKKLKRDK